MWLKQLVRRIWRRLHHSAALITGLLRFAHRFRLLRIGILLFSAGVTAFIAPRGYSALRAAGQIYALDHVPTRSVAIVFGAGVDDNGGLSDMLADRVKMAVKLYQAGKVNAILMTGDNHIKTYNEPEAMRDYALRLGVPHQAISLDYAGFRTYDSCYRARDIFKVDSAILVTQAYHLDRALLICNRLGIESVGVAADVLRPEGYDRAELRYGQIREFPSTILSMADLLRGKQPTFLGQPLPIFPNTRGYMIARD